MPVFLCLRFTLKNTQQAHQISELHTFGLRQTLIQMHLIA